MDNFYVLQTRIFGLGNFINLTPTLQSVAKATGSPVPVYFELKHVEQCFIDCDFINILDEQPFERALFGSGLIDAHNNLPDYIFAHREVSKAFTLDQNIPHTYIDTADEIPKDKRKYTLFMFGSGSEDEMYVDKKQPDKSYYIEYMNKGIDIFTGSVTDFNRVNWFNHMEHYLDDIRKSLALVRDAELIITNDTGLAHAAGAMNKNMIILWKYTQLPKSGNPGKNTLIRLVR